MTASWIVALSFFTVSTVLLTSGINALQSNSQAPANRVFFALTMAIAIWSAGMALSAQLLPLPQARSFGVYPPWAGAQPTPFYCT